MPFRIQLPKSLVERLLTPLEIAVPELQLRNHLGRIPVGPEILNLAVVVNFKDVDAFEFYVLAVAACACTNPLHGRAIARNKN